MQSQLHSSAPLMSAEHLKWSAAQETESLSVKGLSPLPWLQSCEGSQDSRTKLDFSFHIFLPQISMGEASLCGHNAQIQHESAPWWTMSLAAWSVFKLHEKFMSLLGVTSAYYHHILSCLGNRFLLGTRADSRGEASVRKNSQHPAGPSVTTTSGWTSFTSGTYADIWRRGDGTKEPTAHSLHLPTNLSVIFQN